LFNPSSLASPSLLWLPGPKSLLASGQPEASRKIGRSPVNCSLLPVASFVNGPY
jgi:hypothetical protein